MCMFVILQTQELTIPEDDSKPVSLVITINENTESFSVSFHFSDEASEDDVISITNVVIFACQKTGETLSKQYIAKSETDMFTGSH